MDLFIAMSICIYVIGAFGIFGNINIVIAIYRIKPRMKSNLLIGILAFIDTFCILAEWHNATRIVLGIESRREECFFIISPYLFLCKMQTTLMCAVAFDRLFAFTFPLRYIRVGDYRYVALCCVPGVVSAVFFLSTAVYHMEDAPIVSCNPPLAYPPWVSFVWSKWIIIFDSSTLILLILAMIVMLVRKRQMNKSVNSFKYRVLQRQRKVSKACTVMVVVFLFTTFFSHSGMNLVKSFGAQQSVVENVQTLAVLPMIVTFAQAFYVYWWSSRLYRKAFKEQLKVFLPTHVLKDCTEITPVRICSIGKAVN